MLKTYNRAMAWVLALMLALSLVAVPASAEVLEKAAKPESVSLSFATKTMLPGTTLLLTAAVEPADASQKVTWKSSKSSVAKVSSTGKVTAVKVGTATITATTKTGKKKGACVITVGYDFAGVKYRFFGIANADYYGSDSDLASPGNDLTLMKNTFSKGSFGGSSCEIYYGNDFTGNGIRKVLGEMSTNYGITANDVTVFYYSGHGLASKTKANRGALCGVDLQATSSGFVTVSEVQQYLDKVPGIVVVIMDSCLSGQYIKPKGLNDDTTGTSQSDINAFNAEWINAFAGSRAKNYNPNSKALGDSPVKSKYKILTGCAARESSYLNNFMLGDQGPYPFSFLTIAFWEGAIPYGTPAKMDADKNADGIVTLKEAYTFCKPYVNKCIKNLNKKYPKQKAKQTVQMWPSSDNFPMMANTAAG